METLERLQHFRALSTKLDADRIAFNAAQQDLLTRINDASAIAAQITEAETAMPEKERTNATKQRAEVRRLKAERAALKAPSFHDPLPDIERYIKAHPRFTKDERPSIEIPPGQTPLAVHNNSAEMTDRVIAEIGRVVMAPSAPEDLAAIITSQIDSIATPPRLVAGRLVFPKHVTDSNGMAITVTNTEGLFAWLFRDAIIEKMKDPFGDPGLTASERGTKLVALYDKLMAALRLESDAALAAEQAGQRVIRRRHVHPAILLGQKIAPATVYEWMSKKRGV